MSSMFGDMKRVMLLIDDKSTFEEVSKRAPPSLRGDLPEIIQRLIDSELVRDKDKVVVAPKITAPKVIAPKQASAPVSEELDFTSMATATSAGELAKQASQREAEQKSRQEAELARIKAEQEAQRKQAELQAAAKAKAEAEAAHIRAEQEAARVKAEMEEARVRAEADAKAKAQALADARAREQAEAARLKAEQEARVKAELAAAAKAKAEAEAARIKAEQEAAKIKAELDAAKARAEAEAAKIKAELEAAKAKAEAEAKALAEARAKQEAEAARLRAEQEAARIKAEQEAARLRAEQEAVVRARAEAEEKARAEAEAARLLAEKEMARVKAEQEAARIKAEQEAAVAKAELEVAKARADAESKALAEERARHAAEEARMKAEQEAARIKAKKEADELAQVEAAQRTKAAQAARLKAEQEEAARLLSTREAEEKTNRDAQSARQTENSGTPKTSSAFVPEPFTLNFDALKSGAPVAETVVTQAPQAEQIPMHAAHSAQQEAEAEAKALEEQIRKQRAAAEEMARLKTELETERIRAELESKAQEEEQALATEQAEAWAEAEQRAKLQAELDARQEKQQDAVSQAKSVQKAKPKTPRKPLPLFKISFVLLVLAILVIAILPLVWPLQEFIAPMEQRMSAQLKQPVKIGSISATALPMPKVELQNVRIGATDEIKVSSLVLQFDPLGLFSKIKDISNIEVQGVVMDGRKLEQLANSLQHLGADVQYPVRHLSIKNLQVNAEGVSLPALSGSADLAEGVFTRVVLHSDDNKMNIEVVPQQKLWQLSFGVKESALPLLPAVMFGDFSAKGVIGDGEVDFSEIDAHAYGGILSGRAKMSWRKGWQLQGRMQAKTMELEKLYPQLGSGELFADGTFSMQSNKLSQFGDSPKVDGSFSAKRGVINGMDMVETARLYSRDHLPGGRTHFDDVTGTVQLESRVRRFRQVRITSGMLSAIGSFDISTNGLLSGNFNAEIKMRPGNNLLQLSGTTSEPKLQAR